MCITFVLFTTQSNKDFIQISYQDNPLEYVYDKSINPDFLITSKNLFSINEKHKMKMIETGLTLFNVYKLKHNSTGIIKFDYILYNTYPDNWIMDNAELLIAGIENENQIEIILELGTNINAGNIIAILTDSTGTISNIPVSPDVNSISLILNKKPDEQNFKLNFGSIGYFIPAELGLSPDGRKLTYYVTRVEIKR